MGHFGHFILSAHTQKNTYRHAAIFRYLSERSGPAYYDYLF